MNVLTSKQKIINVHNELCEKVVEKYTYTNNTNTGAGEFNGSPTGDTAQVWLKCKLDKYDYIIVSIVYNNTTNTNKRIKTLLLPVKSQGNVLFDLITDSTKGKYVVHLDSIYEGTSDYLSLDVTWSVDTLNGYDMYKPTFHWFAGKNIVLKEVRLDCYLSEGNANEN